MPYPTLDRQMQKWIFKLFSFYYLLGYKIQLMKRACCIHEAFIKKKAPLFSTDGVVRRRTIDAVSNREAFPFFVKKSMGVSKPYRLSSLKIRRFHNRDSNQMN